MTQPSLPYQTLEDWVRAKYWTVGIDSTGAFIGKGPFKNKLMTLYNNDDSLRLTSNKTKKQGKHEIRRLVNARAYLPWGTTAAITEPRPPLIPAQEYNPPLQTATQTTIVPVLGPQERNSDGNLIDGATGNVIMGAGIESQSYDLRGLRYSLRSQTSGNLPDVPNAKSPGIQDPYGNPNQTLNMHNSDPKRCSIHTPAQFSSNIQAFIDDIINASSQDIAGSSRSDQYPEIPTMELQFPLLGSDDFSEDSHMTDFAKSDVRDSVIFSGEVLKQHASELLPQYGLLGSVCQETKQPSMITSDPRLFLNTNIPYSAFICGLQGSGKSHTVSCILENSLIQNSLLGSLQRPLSAIVFHFSEYTSRLNFRPCEAAFLAYPDPQFRDHMSPVSVKIMVAPSNYHNLHAAYSQIPKVEVRPFRLRAKDLNISSILTLMSVNQTEAAPLYMSQITKILRDIAAKSAGDFDYKAFKKALDNCSFSKAQKGPLRQRLDLLESFLDLDDTTPPPNFDASSITIFDLSCPFVDSNTACVIFNICIGTYLGSNPTTGKIIAIDEAHKYITKTPASLVLTASLLTIIRQQRHHGARVLISTQEPTISPRLMDLCSMIIMHRFSSPEWFDVVRKHVSIADSDKASLEELFGRIVDLRVGQALVFAPSGILARQGGKKDLVRMGSQLVKVKVRKRVTWDGGKSVVCL